MAPQRKTILSELESARTKVYREHVSDAAEKIFARAGYEKATIRQIAKEADISVGSVYGVFQSKTELYSFVHQRHYEELAKQSVQAMQAGPKVMGILLAGARLTGEYFCSHPDFLRIQILSGHAWSVENTGSDMERAAWTAGIELIAQTITNGIASGELPEGKAHRLSRVIMSGYQAILAHWLEEGATESTEEVVMELQEFCRRVLCPSE